MKKHPPPICYIALRTPTQNAPAAESKYFIMVSSRYSPIHFNQ